MHAACPIAIAAVFATLLGGCASTDCVAPLGNPALTPARVSASGGHEGELVRWGGVLAESRNLASSTELTVIGYPLDPCGVPRSEAVPVGRFILVRDGYLETAEYPPGTRLVATGMILDRREDRVGDARIALPLVKGRSIRWWPAQTLDPGPFRPYPVISVGIGGWSGGMGGGIGVHF